MNKKTQGFTLIELMIVIAIVAILAAIALPAYRDYLIRSKVSEAAAAVGACKTSVSEFAYARNAWPADVNEAGCSNVATQYLASMAVNAGAITATTQATGATPGECQLTLTPTGGPNTDITAWTGTHAGCDAKFVPATFR
jgi:type IV pilus assembly protein PilA